MPMWKRPRCADHLILGLALATLFLAACAADVGDNPGGADGGTNSGGAGGAVSTGGAGPTASGGSNAGTGGVTASGGSGLPDGAAGSGGLTGTGGGTETGGATPTSTGGAGGRSVSGGTGGAGGLGGTSGAGGGGRAGSAGNGGAAGPVTVFIAGDSTVSTYAANAANMQAGWGQMLAEYFNAQVKVSNQAIGGRTSRRFIGEGRLTTILNAMKPGDYLMVQFGTNDGNTTAVYADGEPYFVNATDFQMYMNQYIDGARGKQGIPILVTPPPRASCTGDSHTFGNGLLGYANAMKTVAAAKNAALIDLNAKSVAYLNGIGCVAAKANFFLLNDGTHFQRNGARIMAGFVADGVVQLGLPLAAYRLP